MITIISVTAGFCLKHYTVKILEF